MGLVISNVEQNIRKGWLGRLEGMKQVVFERELLDLDSLETYTKDDPNDDKGKINDESFLLKKIILSLTDFVEGATLLQHMTKKIASALAINVIVDCSPKCHP
eukprot:15362936-Ditylum_brightwellii.AAC.1